MYICLSTISTVRIKRKAIGVRWNDSIKLYRGFFEMDEITARKRGGHTAVQVCECIRSAGGRVLGWVKWASILYRDVGTSSHAGRWHVSHSPGVKPGSGTHNCGRRHEGASDGGRRGGRPSRDRHGDGNDGTWACNRLIQIPPQPLLALFVDSTYDDSFYRVVPDSNPDSLIYCAGGGVSARSALIHALVIT
jgi:hypothetical protein